MDDRVLEQRGLGFEVDPGAPQVQRRLLQPLTGLGNARRISAQDISYARGPDGTEWRERAAAITPQFGIELVDVRIKRLNYVGCVQAKVFDRMISERKRIAERSRSEGQGRAAEILGEKERDMKAASAAGYRSAQAMLS